MIHHLEGFIPFWDDKLTDHRETTAVLSVNKPAKVESIIIVPDCAGKINVPSIFASEYVNSS